MRAFIGLLVMGAVGCAQSFVMVPDAEWKTVPAAERAAIDRDHAAAVARADAERDAAVIALSHVRAEQPARAVEAPRLTAMAGVDPSVIQFERDKQAAMAAVTVATADWQKARIAFHERRVELAEANAAVLRCSYEVTRAKAVDHHRLGFDTYDSAQFRGQLSHTQERWYRAQTRMDEARQALTRATAALARSKDAYAAVVRAAPHDKRSMELADWNDWPLRERASWRKRTNAGSGQYLTLGGRIARK